MKIPRLFIVCLLAACKEDEPASVVDAGEKPEAAVAETPAQAPCTPAVSAPAAFFASRIGIPGDTEGCPPGADCGYLPNGPLLNGTSLDATGPNKDILLESASYASLVAGDGTRPETTSLHEGQLVLKAGERVLPIENATLTGVRRSPLGADTARLRIRDVATTGGLVTYAVEYESVATDACDAATAPVWRPLCTEGQAVKRAVFVDAVWDYGAGAAGNGARSESSTNFTIACLDTGAIAKCMQQGYLPWAERAGCTGPAGTCGLAAHHQACVRALRADFCNNGFPLTDPGTEIRVYDTLPINPKRPGSKGEASWRADGSLCISETRLASLVKTQGTSRPFSVRDYIDQVCPGKFTAKGREPWGGLCAETAAGLTDAEQIFTEFPVAGDAGAPADAAGSPDAGAGSGGPG